MGETKMSRQSEKSQKTVLKDGENPAVPSGAAGNAALYPQAVGMHGQ
jgi:hypothetical protein